MKQVSFNSFDNLQSYLADHAEKTNEAVPIEALEAITTLGKIAFSSDKRTQITLSTADGKATIEIESSILFISEIKELFSAMQSMATVDIAPYGDGKIKLKFTLR